MRTPEPTISPQSVKRGRPNAQRPARINLRISQAAADHFDRIHQQRTSSRAATLETIILQFEIETNKKPDTLMHQ